MVEINTLFCEDNNFKSQFELLLKRGAMDCASVTPAVNSILVDIQKNGLEAILKQVSTYDAWQPKNFNDLVISPSSMQTAYEKLDKNLKEALQIAYERIFTFHKKQMPKTWLDFEPNGTVLGQKVSAVDRAGLYVPGGKAAYPSSLLMNAIPAIVAGVGEIIVCTPTPKDEINELLLAAMHLCGIKKAYKIGGASAIGAMAFGFSEGEAEVKPVDVITGPGNIFVATAKKLVFGVVNIDMIAGPSEIGILADSSARADLVALDLLSQAEHDEMASSILITTSKKLAEEVPSYLEKYLKELPRVAIAQKSINERGAIIVARDLREATSLMNAIAPEHLEVLCENLWDILPHIKHAGAIFLGNNTPEPIGDYLAGPNHTLPTGGSAHFFSPLSVECFLKKSSILSFSREAIETFAKPCATLAHAEGLDAHRLAVEARLNL